jgi:hypothetical protein
VGDPIDVGSRASGVAGQSTFIPLQPTSERQDQQDEQNDSGQAAANHWSTGIEPTTTEENEQYDQNREQIHESLLL